MSDELVLQLDPPYAGSAVSPTVDITETTTDVTVTITDFRGEHSYSVEKTDQAIADAEQATSNANTAAASANQAATAATTAAGTANTAATNADAKAALADSKAGLADSAATTANQAAQAAEAAKTAANTAAGQATTAAGNATTAAQSATTAAGNADAKAQLADTAAANADTATANANTATTNATNAAQTANNAADYAIEAADDMPKLVNTASGTTAQTVNDAWPATPESAVLYGKSVQDGTPTPDNPVPVQVVGGRNLVNWNVSPFSNALNVLLEPNDYTMSASSALGVGSWYIRATDTQGVLLTKDELGLTGWNEASTTGVFYGAAYSNMFTFTLPRKATVEIGKLDTDGTIPAQLEAGTQATPYLPYGYIGLKIGNEITPIDLEENVLASLPDGTRDVLLVDSAGVKEISQRVGVVDLGTCTWNYVAQYGMYSRNIADLVKAYGSNTLPNVYCDAYRQGKWVDLWSGGTASGLISVTETKTLAASTTETDPAAFKAAMSGVLLYYELATPVTHSLGTMELPELTSPCELAFYASLDPEWQIDYEQDPNIVVTALQSSIAPVEGSTASANYAVNSYLIHDNQLYRVTSAIATGEAITPGSNCVACTVMGELVRLTA